MASIGHIAVGMAAGRAFTADPALAKKAAIAFSLVSLWADLDAIGFLVGVHYRDTWGHRGATHSIALALAVGILARLFAPRWKLPANRTAIFATIVAVSHPLLDTMTYGGGLGCALAWPFSTERFWAPLRFIPISPIGLALFSKTGLIVMLVELVLFSPFWLYWLRGRRTPVS
jgi:inner membrane protein